MLPHLPSDQTSGRPTPEQYMTAVFASLVMQQTNMALMFLGKIPNPDTQEVGINLEAAQLFVDQLEMVEAKTKGNLTTEEANLLNESLTVVRLAFVEAAAAKTNEPTTSAG